MKRITIPFLIDLLIVTDSDVITKLNSHPDISRQLTGKGHLLHRLMFQKIRSVFKINDRYLPVFLAREDQERKLQQEALTQTLTNQIETYLHDNNADIDLLAGYVSGGEELEVGVIVQQLVGRMFFKNYEADMASFNAAKELDAWPRRPPIIAFFIRHFGKVMSSLSLLMNLMIKN